MDKPIIKAFKTCLRKFRKSFKEAVDMSEFEQQNIKTMANVYIVGLQDLVGEYLQIEKMSVTDRMKLNAELKSITDKIMGF